MSYRIDLTRRNESAMHSMIDQAAEWLVILEERELTESEKAELAEWRQQSPLHEQIWQAAMRFKGMMAEVPSGLGKQIWGRARVNRRAVLKTLVGMAILVPAGKVAVDQWPAFSADYRTATGEQRVVNLGDGSQLQLNTATLVNIRFSDDERLIELIEGEIFVITAQHNGTGTHPFIVQTRVGRIRALGTRFSVHHTGEGTTHVSVYEHAVAIQPAEVNAEKRVEAGKSINFDQQRMSLSIRLLESVPPWTQGQIISDNQRLCDFIAELARYRPGILRCDPAVADLRISGVFQVRNTDQALNILASTLPVDIRHVTNYWVTVTSK